MKILLKVFGQDLLDLTFNRCSNEVVTLEDLLSCSKLESLRFQRNLPITSVSLQSIKFPPVTKDFLPNLKSFESNICLGSTWSRIFEEKLTLTSVKLNCVHIGTEVSLNFTFRLSILLISYRILMNLYLYCIGR